MTESSLRIEKTRADCPAAIGLIEQLSNELAAQQYDNCDGRGNFLAHETEAAGGCFLVGYLGDQPVACGAYRPLTGSVAELKRMFVATKFRGRGYSKAMLAALERRALADGYHTLRLETGDRQFAALRLYRSSGYCQIDKFGIYRDKDYSVCFEKKLA